MSTSEPAPIGAQIVDGLVVALILPHPDGFELSECYPADAGVVAIPAGVTVAVGMTYAGGAFGPAPAAPAPSPADLLALKARLKAQVDERAEALRLTLITPGSGQAMEYQEAFNEAVLVSNTLAANASATIDPAKFPMLAASLGFDLDPQTGKATTDIPGEARAVLAAYDAYQKAGAAIRGARLAGKAAIDAATDVAGAEAASAAIAWPTLV